MAAFYRSLVNIAHFAELIPRGAYRSLSLFFSLFQQQKEPQSRAPFVNASKARRSPELYVAEFGPILTGEPQLRQRSFEMDSSMGRLRLRIAMLVRLEPHGAILDPCAGQAR